MHSFYTAILISSSDGWNEKEREARGKATNHFAPTYLKKAFSIELLATRTERWGDGDVNCCMYSYAMGHCHWSNWQQMGKSDGSSKSEGWCGFLMRSRCCTILRTSPSS